eukprot:SAG25_NODE_971_length_4480_cov_26.107053_4_plen_69_part_00
MLFMAVAVAVAAVSYNCSVSYRVGGGGGGGAAAAATGGWWRSRAINSPSRPRPVWVFEELGGIIVIYD